MKLQEFINHRTNCPFCKTGLVTYLKTGGEHPLKYEDDRLVAMVPMNGLTREDKDYKIGYSFGPNDNSVQVEFYTSSGRRYDSGIHRHLMDKFWELYRNWGGGFWFIKYCTFCKKYFSGTNPFDLQNKLCSYPNLSIRFETFWFVVPYADRYKIISLSNRGDYFEHPRHSELSIWDDAKDTAGYDKPLLPGRTNLSVPTIPFISVEETGTRIIRLLPFL